MDDLHELPCPTCGELQKLDASDLQPGQILPCMTCRCHLVLTEDLTLARATNADMERRPIREQEVGRLFQAIWSGMPRDMYC